MMIGKFIPIGGDESLSYRKEFNVKTMKAIGNDGYVGLREDGEDYHVYTKYWTFEPAWNGDGLPPVGLLVELMDDSQSQTWGDVTIKFYGDSFAVWDDHGEECSNSLCHVKVRPIRTEAERRRDDEIAEMASTPKPCGHAIYDICAQLYDAGYRKVEVSDD